MFKFIKSLFSADKEEVEREEIKLGELSRWFESHANRISSELDLKIGEIKQDIKEEITKTKDNLAVLSTANLHNPKITVREVQFMEGNRKAYILGVNSFLRLIELDNKNHTQLLDFCYEFNTRLELFGKSTLRSYHVLQEFFAHESRDIAINIKNLDAKVKEINSAIDNANIAKLNEVKENILNLNNKVKQRNEFEILLTSKEKHKESLLSKKHEIEKEVNELRKSQDHKHLQELKAHKEALLASAREHNSKIIHAFSVIERPMKKLARVVLEDGEILERYMQDPVEALVSDKHLKIKGLLGRLENHLNDYTLELKDKKREKVLETLKELTDETLKEFLSKHNELGEKLDKMESEISENETRKKEARLNEELDKANESLIVADKEIEDNKKEIDSINISEIKKNLEKEINGLLKADVVIS
ncbi:MAG: hypothetical protein KKC75_03195 [Nanoarchaeota archaeon]|nr:hypothetical protein [Nanoarchaeota archaeon]MBU1004781.1 hypothetical protein [Nanoarchaeota archaeon]MBU1945549.1 hypothetical protein [Nanoarchaeota archaeon]